MSLIKSALSIAWNIAYTAWQIDQHRKQARVAMEHEPPEVRARREWARAHAVEYPFTVKQMERLYDRARGDEAKAMQLADLHTRFGWAP